LGNGRPENLPETQDSQTPVRSNRILCALGDNFSRRILQSSIQEGKTVEGISEEEHLPLSTCYRRVRQLVDDGLMILERIVITPRGKRYGIYRTSFSSATIAFDGSQITVQVTPNADVREKLRARWFNVNFAAQNPDDTNLVKLEA